MMKKVISLLLALTFIFALTGCTKKDMGRMKYNYNMSKFVELCEYEGIKIDTNGEEYKKTYADMMAADVSNYDLYVKVTEGKLKKGDVANIDYEGKLNGVAFDGGTATGTDLELGSGQFIPGFEDKLIGVEIGKTVDLDLTFPSDYSNTTLAGKAVVFTVKVNYVSVYEKHTEGTLKNGDTVNIDFEGKIDGKTFSGGTATGYDLVLGSGSFIDGFEDKLIGEKIGTTVDLDLTFPTNYTAELAGKDVVFTVKINYVKNRMQKTPEEYYKDLGCESVEEYYDTVNTRAVNNILLTKVLADSKVKKYPKDEKNSITEQGKKMFESNLQQQYGTTVTLDYYLEANGQTEEEFNEYVLTNYTEPLMEEEMVIYAVFDAAGLKMDKEALKEKTKEIVASYGSDTVTETTIKEAYGEDYFEYVYVQEKVLDYLNKKAKIS